MNDKARTTTSFRPPSIEQIVADERYAQWVTALSRPLVTALAREAVEDMRKAESADADALDQTLRALLERWRQQSLIPVINATGVLIHTNLGRAPLDREFWDALFERLSGYGSLEYDLDKGERGHRGMLVHRLIAEIADAEAGLVVNNCAGALLLMLAQARDREVIVSRGELVQIGGGFRVPDIMAQSGVHLVDVGTTNKTVLRDYTAAIGSDTAAILKVHHSNFQMSGFVEDVTSKQLADLCGHHQLLMIEDLGSGAVLDLSKYGLPRERMLSDAVRDGADLVSVSGDKLLGGPQAGLIAGKGDAVMELARHPLYRALRPDKISLTALELTLRAHLSGTAESKLPLYRLLATTPDVLIKRAESIAAGLPDDRVRIESSEAVTGGGTLPDAGMPSVAVVVNVADAGDAAAQLRRLVPPIIARVVDDALWFDLKSVFADQDAALKQALTSITG